LKYKKIYASAGWHPHDAKAFDKAKLLELLRRDKVVAIGEIGLDYYRNLSPKQVQKKVFEKQIQIAMEKNLPIVVHDRNAHKDVMQILKKYLPKKVVFHCYAGDYPMAQEIVKKGWYISFTGVITFDKPRYYSIIKDLPENRYFVETDAPFLTPHPYRGKRNRPEYVKYIIQQIAEVKGETPIKIAEITNQNAERFFNI